MVTVVRQPPVCDSGAEGIPMNVAVMSDHLCAFGCEGDVALEGLILGGCQDFGEVHGADARVEAGKAAADVHEAGVVAHDQDLGARGHDAGDLVCEHGGGGFGVLHGEGAAETAADLGVGQVDEGQALDGAQEAVGAVADLGDTQRVAGRVVGDRVGEVGAHILQAEDIGEELGEVVGVAGDFTAHHRGATPQFERAIRAWDKPASNPTIIAARSSTLSIRRQLTTGPSSSTATTQIAYTL